MHRDDGTTVGKNFFTPCARTHWHSHQGGQILIIESGDGFVADDQGVARHGVGDIVWTPPGVRHWRGGTHDRSLLHTAITFGNVDWQEEVTHEHYESARSAGVVHRSDRMIPPERPSAQQCHARQPRVWLRTMPRQGQVPLRLDRSTLSLPL